jgi:hypothetical protein
MGLHLTAYVLGTAEPLNDWILGNTALGKKDQTFIKALYAGSLDVKQLDGYAKRMLEGAIDADRINPKRYVSPSFGEMPTPPRSLYDHQIIGGPIQVLHFNFKDGTMQWVGDPGKCYPVPK